MKATLNVRGKSAREISQQIIRIQDTIWNQYKVSEGYTTPDGRRGLREYQSERGNELFWRAGEIADRYKRNILSVVKPDVREGQTGYGWLTEDEMNRRVPRGVYMRNNRR